MIIKILVCIIIPLLFFCLILNSETRKHIVYLILGVLCCALAYFVNTMLLKLIGCSKFYLTTTIAPIVEELLKFIPIILGFIIFKFNKNLLFTLAFSLGIGFAITENFYLLSSIDNATILWIILRGLSTGLMHAVSASIIALGIDKTSKYPKLKSVGILSSLFLAMLFHGTYNSLISCDNGLFYVGVFMPIITFTILILINNANFFRAFIEEK